MSYVPTLSSGFTPDQQQKIVAALGEKLRHCSGCGKLKTFQLVTDGIVYMAVESPSPFGYAATFEVSYPTASMYQIPNRRLPCIALICSNCGHLQFHSVFQLGLGPALGLVADPPIYPTGGR